MSERVDDVQEAREWIREALMEDGPGNDSRAALPARLAQAHATLALVEQQRIANLIALARMESRNYAIGKGATDAIWERRTGAEFGEPSMLLRPEIREVLGL